jgi:FKBP-type peptidyl-prolyl cis-trans isomerase FkpA
MRTKISFMSLIAGILIVAVSCSGEYSGFKKTKTGIYYKFHFDNKDGKKAGLGDILTMDMVYRTTDSVLFDSKMNQQPMQLMLNEKQYEGDIFEALALLKVGDSATFIIDAGDFFTQTVGMPVRPEFIAPGSKLYFDVKLNSALTEEEMESERLALQELRKDLEPQELAEYLEINNITTQPTESGIYFIENERGSGRQVRDGDIVTTHFVISTIDGPQLFSTYDNNEPIELEIGEMFDNEGITEALAMTRKGTKATVLIPSSMAYGPEGRGEMVPPYSTMLYEVEVVDVLTQEEYHKRQEQEQRERQREAQLNKAMEQGNIQKYLRENDLSATPTASGLYYIEKVKGSGSKPMPGQKVKVHYTGTLLDGTQFDSSVERGQPFEFQLGQRQVIQGWDEGIAMMNVGSKGLLIVPSNLGYGDRAAGELIPPNSTLIFEVELLGAE